MQFGHPIPEDHDGRRTLEYWHPDGTLYLLTLPELILQHGFEGVRGALLNATPFLANDLPAIVSTLLYLATDEEDPHAVLAYEGLVDELREAGATVPLAYVEGLEALKQVELDTELAAYNAEPMDDPDRAVGMRLERLEQNMAPSWRARGLVATMPAPQSLETARACASTPRPRERRAGRPRGRARAPADDGSEPPPALAGFRRLAAWLHGGGA